MNVSPYHDPQIVEKFAEFDRMGGCIKFKIFQIKSVDSSRQAHLHVAINTLAELKKDWEKYVEELKNNSNIDTESNSFFRHVNFYEKLANTGIRISVNEFFGPHFDLSMQKPLILGRKNSTRSCYFYYDQEEIEGNIIDISHRYEETGGTYVAFCSAFLDTPYGLFFEGGIFERGKYFLDFCSLLFSDLTKIEVYKWSVDSSNYFDAGKEWWGAHFWTIYNPVKNIYIGAVASSTD